MFIDYSDPNHVIIKHKDITYSGKIMSSFLDIKGTLNYIVFNILQIPDRHRFVSDIVGYTVSKGCFPVVKKKEDVIKVIDALNKEYDRQFGSKEYINIENCKNGDYLYIEEDCIEGPEIVASSKQIPLKSDEPIFSTKDYTVSINNFIKTKKHYQLNFNN